MDHLVLGWDEWRWMDNIVLGWDEWRWMDHLFLGWDEFRWVHHLLQGWDKWTSVLKGTQCQSQVVHRNIYMHDIPGLRANQELHGEARGPGLYPPPPQILTTCRKTARWM